MPFKSEKQRRYLYAEKPEVARKFEEHEKQERKEPDEKRRFRQWAGFNTHRKGTP